MEEALEWSRKVTESPPSMTEEEIAKFNAESAKLDAAIDKWRAQGCPVTIEKDDLAAAVERGIDAWFEREMKVVALALVILAIVMWLFGQS